MNSINIRQVEPADLDAACVVEAAAFPADEAAAPAKIKKRLETYPDGFLVAEENKPEATIVGLVMCGATHQPDLADEELKDMVGHDPDGENFVVFSVAVLPRAQGQGLGGKLVGALVERARVLGKRHVLLLCKENLIPFYQRYGFADVGLSASTHGGARWHEMRCDL